MTTYSSSQAARMIGVAQITLKRALLSGRVDEVRKDRNGWRVFTDEDVERLRRFFTATQPPITMPLFRDTGK